MALTRLNAFPTGSVVTNSIITGEFDNIYNNALTLISPLTANLAAGGFILTGLGLGSAASPSLQFTGDTNTGIYASAADALDLSVGGSRHLTLVGGTPVAGVAVFDPSALTATASTNVARLLVANTAALTIPAGTTAVVAGLRVEEPNITATGTVTAAASLYVEAAPTEGTNNYSLWVDAGNALFDGDLRAESMGVGVAASAVAGRLTVNENLIVSGAGPHAIGAATNARYQLALTGSFTAVGATLNAGLFADTSLSNASGVDMAGIHFAPRLTNVAGATTNASFLQLDASALTITAGSVTNAATLRIVDAPSGATNNYALWGASGPMRWDGTIFGGTTLTLASLTGNSMLFGRVASVVPGAFTEDMRLTSGVLTVGHTVTTNALGGDVVTSNNRGLRGLNAAGDDALAVIRLNASDLIAFGATRSAAAVAGNFAANFYIRFQDTAGSEFFVPAMNASW